MPSYSRSLRAETTEINGRPVQSVPEESVHSRKVQSSRESGLTIFRKATNTPPQRPTRAIELIDLFMYEFVFVPTPVQDCSLVWGQLETNYLEFGWLVPKTGLDF